MGPLELMDVLDVGYPRLETILSLVSAACAPSAKTVSKMHSPDQPVFFLEGKRKMAGQRD